MCTTSKHQSGRMSCELSSALLYPDVEQIADVDSTIQFADASTKQSPMMLRHSVPTSMA
ncbi:hypothetical protein AUR04nite_34460 [Glutamicibacter uratoxydans]|uniref:Uncharacterized protein n=1 Tax=Glutamicibacter uratoxydans TaxID=43667 RepID=A0A4Y4DVP5_GLUUR|nr:hypothetical protein [Glutamicibacter uratoxydans]GED07914.1 hypothetical protein AUR04nite_34460 [Glutamicibacter uratoxydans]